MAKSELLTLTAWELGIPARYVCWLYLLPEVVPEARELPSRLDEHRAVQVRVGQRWMLADATHHPGLWHPAAGQRLAGRARHGAGPTCGAGDRGGTGIGRSRQPPGRRRFAAVDPDPAPRAGGRVSRPNGHRGADPSWFRRAEIRLSTHPAGSCGSGYLRRTSRPGQVERSHQPALARVLARRR